MQIMHKVAQAAAFSILTGATFLSGSATAGAQEKPDAEKMKRFQEMAPGKGYLNAHKDLEKPFELLGGPIEINVSQKQGGAFVALPDNRELDPRVFGTPEFPKAFGGTPLIYGVPAAMRGQEDGKYTEVKELSPFGDNHMVVGNGRLGISAQDSTATDARVTSDTVDFSAQWEDNEGNVYQVRCCSKLAAHGLEYPTFGGVLTNHLLHGFTRIGTPLMPTEFAYFAFWGMGEVMKNGKVLDKPRLVHGMLTEYVRTDGYELAFDSEVNPGQRHFHLMVPPMMPNEKTGHFEKSPVKTGFNLPNGKELPFWHVMFNDLDIQAKR